MANEAKPDELCELQIVTVPRSANPYDWINEKRTFSGHTAISVVVDGKHVLTEGFTPKSDLDMVLPVASYWVEALLPAKVSDWLKGSKEAEWHDDSPMLSHPQVRKFGIEVPQELAVKFLDYFDRVKAASEVRYTLLPGRRSTASEMNEKNCVYSAVNVLVDFLYAHQSEFTEEQWNDIEPKLTSMIEDTARCQNTKQGNMNKNIGLWTEMKAPTITLVQSLIETLREAELLSNPDAPYIEWKEEAEKISQSLTECKFLEKNMLKPVEALFRKIANDTSYDMQAKVTQWEEMKHKFGVPVDLPTVDLRSRLVAEKNERLKLAEPGPSSDQEDRPEL